MKFIFTCGGTAGHINPAIAVAGKLKELMPDTEVLFIGANNKMEMQLVPREGYEIKGLTVSNLQRSLSPKAIVHNINSVKNVIASRIEAKRIIKRFKPDAVIGTGGYVCYPVLKAAADLKIPTLVHESNAVPGLTTKMLADKVDRVLVGFEESRQYYGHPEKVEVTGTPVRGAFDSFTKAEAKAKLGLKPEEKLVVSVWGSLGAQHMNDIMQQLIPMLDGNQGFKLLHAAGSRYYKGISEALADKAESFESMGVEVREYIYDMPCVMAAADLILCRAGASTISELCYMAKPVIMVPSPNVTNAHQEKNARVLERAGGAKVMLEGQFDAVSLLAEIKSLLGDDEKLAAMSESMRGLAVPEATGRICEIILGLVN
ncbi:MAG: undecaprenyldiphospho-muramoylpentapeptide beta-N-acetylglucosaminyltransferase [Oscillospiraceae bacterium]|nr:undecaprenyldiphospho-muramoylpentapeptide beta-N-acetylglucosaminyltransferase [Oscillospiraceae bacterium]